MKKPHRHIAKPLSTIQTMQLLMSGMKPREIDDLVHLLMNQPLPRKVEHRARHMQFLGELAWLRRDRGWRPGPRARARQGSGRRL